MKMTDTANIPLICMQTFSELHRYIHRYYIHSKSTNNILTQERNAAFIVKRQLFEAHQILKCYLYCIFFTGSLMEKRNLVIFTFVFLLQTHFFTNRTCIMLIQLTHAPYFKPKCLLGRDKHFNFMQLTSSCTIF